MRHNLANEALWSFDVWPHEAGMIACVHGEFEECNDDKGVIVRRSFDRTFVLRAGGDGGVKVGSDLLVVRAYGGYDAWKEAPAVVPGEAEQKRAMCVEFARRSGLTMEFAEMCLSTVEWDLEKGWAAFVEASVGSSFCGGAGQG